METQLRPLARELEKDNSASFFFTQGELDSPPGPGVEDVYEGPYFCFYPWPHDLKSLDTNNIEAVEEAYELIYEAIETDGPFDGILGFSQGATLAYHAKAHPFDLPLFRCGVFICAIPPFWVEDGEVVYRQDVAPLSIPSLHIACSRDPVYKHSQALYEHCQKGAAAMINLDKGHTIPGDPKSAAAIGNAVRDLTQRAVFTY